MNNAIYTDPARRHDFLLLFDVTDGNPNGDPDAGNMPRIDPETGQGLVTDVCLKRKVRNYVEVAKQGADGFGIFIQERGILNRQIDEAYSAQNIDLQKDPNESSDRKRKEKGKAQGSEIEKGRAWLCQRKYDIRMFGAVLMTGPNAGQVRGPVQMTFARSIDPVMAFEVSITRMAVASEEEAEKQGGDNRTMGRKAILPYGLYLSKGFFSAPFAQKTGVTEADLDLFWTALGGMWDLDRSASRGMMSCRGLHVFSHDSPLGNSPAHLLFDRLTTKLKPDVTVPRRFQDYEVQLEEHNMPAGVVLNTLLQ